MLIDEEKAGLLQQHYLGSLLSKIPLSPIWCAVVGGVLSYTLFLLRAGLAGWTQVMTSFLHLWQVNHSITILAHVNN
jgi:hypothetical protein